MEGSLFLSYAAEDVEIANQVAKYLESCGWSVWWDRKILAGRPYDQAIEEALQGARCAVVLWTSAAVASRWVRSEASEAARRDILVPAILEDVAIPLEFRLVQAVDLRKWDRSADAVVLTALHDAVACTVNRPPARATLPAREADASQAQKQRGTWLRGVVLAPVALLCLFAAGVGWYWDAFYRERAEYYANVRRRWGLPEGVGRLSANQVARRNVTIALVRRGRRHAADEVRIVNSARNVPSEGTYFPSASVAELNPLQSAGANGPASSELVQVTRVTFARDAEGRILEQAAFNRGGRRLYTIHFAQPDVGEYKQEGFGTAVRESGISYLRFSRHGNGPNAGLDERVEYLDDKQRLQADEWGTYGYRLVLDGSGLIAETINLGPDGAEKANGYGVFKEIVSRDQLGNVVEATTVDERGALRVSRLGTAIGRLEYDSAGNITRFSFLDTTGKPVTVQMLGAASWAATYDARGNRTSFAFFGPDQQLVAGGPLHVAKTTTEWQTATRSLMRFYGVNGRPIPAFAGAFEGLQTWDARGYAVETTYRDEKGEVTRVETGCAGDRMRYDDLGNLIEYTCLNERAAETISAAGFSSLQSTYDGFGNELTTVFFRQPRVPGLVGEAYASIRRAYTPFGKVEKETYLDVRGLAVKTRQGFGAVTYEYDSRGNQIARRYWDERGGLATAAGGYAAIRSTFDGRGLEVETGYLDANNKPVRSADGFATQRFDYDDRGYLNRLRLFGEDGKPTRGIEGYSSARIKRNAAGQRLEVDYFDETAAPMVAIRSGTARRRWTYDTVGRVVERSDYDISGKPLRNVYGYSIVRYSYDDYGRETGRDVLDTEGRKLQFHVAVDRIVPHSVAADSGLRVNDVILTYDGEVVSTSYQFTNKLELFKGDRARELGIKRTGQTLSLDVSPGRLRGLELAERVTATQEAPPASQSRKDH